MNKIFLFFIFFIEISFSQECGLAHEVMYILAKNEHHPQRKVGYPYLISFNNKRDAILAKKHFKSLFISNKGVDRTLDCKNQKRCVEVLDKVLKLGIKNLDLGSFQLNYIYHKHPKMDYFSVVESYDLACAYAESFTKKYGYTWRSLAKYHSKTPKYRDRYAKRMYDEYHKKDK